MVETNRAPFRIAGTSFRRPRQFANILRDRGSATVRAAFLHDDRPGFEQGHPMMRVMSGRAASRSRSARVNVRAGGAREDVLKDVVDATLRSGSISA